VSESARRGECSGGKKTERMAAMNQGSTGAMRTAATMCGTSW
jgi:hypothetical protein